MRRKILVLAVLALSAACGGAGCLWVGFSLTRGPELTIKAGGG